MKISRKHLLYIIEKLSKIAEVEKSEYEITNDTFSDERGYIGNKLLKNYPYAIKANSMEEAKILYPFFNETGKKNGNFTHKFDINQSGHSSYYCLFEKENSISTNVHENMIRKDVYLKYTILKFEDVKEEIIDFLKAREIEY